MSSSTQSSGIIEISKPLIGCLGVVLEPVIGDIFLLTGIVVIRPSSS